MIKLLSTDFELRTLFGPQAQEISFWGSFSQSKTGLPHSWAHSWWAPFLEQRRAGWQRLSMEAEERRHQGYGICMAGCWAQEKHWEVVPFPFPAPCRGRCDGTAKEGAGGCN